jgi:hypothetical protein
MAQASHWECPAGSGKKIKFCCPDLVGEWEKIIRLWEGEQDHACVEFIHQLERRGVDRPCLWAVKIETLYRLKKIPEAEQAVEQFFQKHPNHPAALMEKAYVLARQGQGEEAYRWLLRGMNLCSGLYPIGAPRVLFLVALQLLSERHLVPSLALLRFGARMPCSVQEDFQEAARALDGNRSFPLLLREAFRWREHLVAHTAAAAPLAQIRQQMEMGRWLDARERLEQLLPTYPELPGLWWHLALIRSWTLDDAGAREALRKYARLDVPAEEAILAEALALALSADPLEDQIPSYKLIYTPQDEGDLQAALSLCKQLVPISRPLGRVEEEDGQLPPRAYYLVFDRTLAGDQEPSAESQEFGLLGWAALYGRQTDREARLVIHNVYEYSRPQVEALFQQFVGQGLLPEVVVEQTGQVSATATYFLADIAPPRSKGQKPDRNQEEELLITKFLRRWLDSPLGIFQGRTPRQAAQDAQSHTLLEAVLLWVEDLAFQQQYPWDRARVRHALGLPPSEPIDPQTVPLREVPLYRWIDVDLDKASDEQIYSGYLYATRFRWLPAAERFANAFLQRPNLASHPMWLSACYGAAIAAMPSEKAGPLIEQGRQRSVQSGKSCAPWDLLALQYHLEREEPEQINSLLQHLLHHHQYEPEVLENLINILDAFGILPDEPAGQPAAEEAPGGLWTPDQEEKPSGEKKLWMPGMS